MLRTVLLRKTPSAALRAATMRRSYSLPPTMPAPPRLPKKEQEEFERLQREANTTNAFQSVNEDADIVEEPILSKESVKTLDFHYHPEYRHIKPDFEGEKNPVTGEIGGPKQDPLRHGDYSFNGRVTDF
ncbi:hypothetical protein D0Z00_003478 [Geotrichum galactomycetum]|uniref:Uncharacterized protein n=1 Tax=Geotrichum galactomycetum TaxID=27317 RepID=A0ACB6V156_9ASCO|nr:hypothetical protein D0Z00_003478 [Geotrichum candidum]